MEEKRTDLDESTSVDKEIILDPNNVIISITDLKGTIEYCNDEFLELTGFDASILVGSKHNLLRHDEMPRALYKYIWGRLKKEEELSAIIKNNIKSGGYYWAIVDFLIRRDDDGNIIGYRSNSRPVSKKVISEITPIYEKLLYLENLSGIDLAVDFLNDYFTRRTTNYDEFIEQLINPYNFSSSLLSAKKKRFSKIRNLFKKK